MGPLDPGRNSMQFANRNVSIACICVRFEPQIIFWNLRFVANNCFLQNQHFLVCFRQSGTIKLTVWTVGSYYDFGEKTDCVGETLPKNSQRWIFHFSSYLIINWFLCKWWIKLIEYRHAQPQSISEFPGNVSTDSIEHLFPMIKIVFLSQICIWT